MSNRQPIKVIQWATGTVGIHAVPGIVAHPDLELAGLWVHSDSKAGQDAGTLCGIEPTGIIATQDADALLACGLIGVERNDAANTDGQRGLARFEGGDAERRNAAIGKIEQALDVTVLDHLRIDDVDRNRRLLQIGFALGRGHHDFLQARTRIGLGCIAGCGRGLRGKRRAQREHGNAAQQSRDGAVSRNHGECPFASSVDGRAIRSVARQ